MILKPKHLVHITHGVTNSWQAGWGIYYPRIQNPGRGDVSGH